MFCVTKNDYLSVFLALQIRIVSREYARILIILYFSIGSNHAARPNVEECPPIDPVNKHVWARLNKPLNKPCDKSNFHWSTRHIWRTESASSSDYSDEYSVSCVQPKRGRHVSLQYLSISNKSRRYPSRFRTPSFPRT